MQGYDDDSWINLAVAKDTKANFLYHNSRNGTLTGEAVLMDAAFDENGKAQDCMGINVTDNDDSYGHRYR